MSVSTRQAEEMVEQAIRKSHCSRAGHEHNCVGTCTIKPGGILLECVLCGKDEDTGYFRDDYRAVARILEAAGISLDCLSGESQVRACVAYREIYTDILKRNGLRA